MYKGALKMKQNYIQALVKYNSQLSFYRARKSLIMKSQLSQVVQVCISFKNFKKFTIIESPPHLKMHIVLNVLKSAVCKNINKKSIMRGFRELPRISKMRLEVHETGGGHQRFRQIIEKNGVLDALIPPCKAEKNIISRHPSHTKKQNTKNNQTHD